MSIRKKSATWCGIINVSIAYQSRRWQALWSARGATISPLIWSTKNESGASRMHRLYFTWEKFLAGNFSFARAVCRFFFVACGRNASTCSARNASKSGRHGVTRDFLLLLKLYHLCRIPVLSHDNVKCTHRLSLSFLREKYKQSSFRNIIRLFLLL